MNGRLSPRLHALLVDATTAAGVPLVVFQGSYSTSVGASAGTHAGGGAFDLDIAGMTHDQALRLVHELRRRGCAAWVRTPEYGYNAPPAHVHGICRDEPGLSPAARQQVAAYDAGRDGLAGNRPDPHPRPPAYRFHEHKDWFTMATKQELQQIIEHVIDSRLDEIAARVNRVLGDYDANGKPVANTDDPQLAAAYIRQIRRLVGRT